MSVADLDNKIEQLRSESHALYRKGDLQGMIRKMEECWNVIPEPKYQNPESFVIAEELVTMHLEDTGNFDEALTWAKKLDECSQNRIDDGTKEFVLGKVYFERKETEEAKKQFTLAMEKSEGRAFASADKKYVNLLKKK